MNLISVVAGGPSVKALDLALIPGVIVGVNDAAVHLPRCDVAVSMDRLWTEARWEWLRERRKPAWIRKSARQNIPGHWPWLHVFDCDHAGTTLSDVTGTLNGTNSGLCALNLAYQLKPEAILLFGFDMKRGPAGEAHWFPPYPWAKPGGATSAGKFADWSKQFREAKRQCDAARIAVALVGDSAIDVFPRKPVDAFKRAAA